MITTEEKKELKRLHKEYKDWLLGNSKINEIKKVINKMERLEAKEDSKVMHKEIFGKMLPL